MVLPVREDLRGELPYGAPQLDVPVCLNVNENPYAPDAAVIREISDRVAEAAAALNRYPNRDFHELREALASYLAVESGVTLPASKIWAANGSNEVMLHILQAFGGPGRTMVSFAPTYSMYPEYARDAFTAYVGGKRNSDFSLDLEEVRRVLASERPAVLVIASPNNPTGTAVTPEELDAVLCAALGSGPDVQMLVNTLEAGARKTSGVAGCDAANSSGETYSDELVPQPSDTIVVVDEAYGEFRRPGVPSALELLDSYPNLVVCRTMSKAFGAAGLRLGYLAASEDIIDQIMLVRLPYHLSAVTQAAALGALKHRESLMAQVAQICMDRDRLVEDLAALQLEVLPSDANFVLFGKFADRHAVWQGLLDRGVLIREVGPEGFLRVSIGTPAENAAFLAALKEVM